MREAFGILGVTGRYLGLDLGTSSIKGLLVGSDGRPLGRAQQAYPTHWPHPGWAQQNLADWLAAVGAVVRDLVPDGTVDAVGVAGHTPSLITIDDRRQATGPAITWQDTRAGAEADELARHFGDERTLIGATLPWNAAYLPAKLLWLGRHGIGDARWLLQPKDAINLALTGVAGTDIWGSKGLCRVDDGTVVSALFEYCDVPAVTLPPRLRPWQPLGTVDKHGSAWSGLRPGTPVAVGWTDALAGMLSVGAFEEPRAFVLTGTSDIVGRSDTDRLADSHLLHVPLRCAPLPVHYGPTQTSGAALLWLAELFGTSPGDMISTSMQADEAHTPRFVPYLDGERAPVWRTDVRASFAGLSARTGRAELARAVLRGVALSNRHVLHLAGHGDEPVHVGGASALAHGWVRARLETFGVEIVLHEEPNLTASGAAMLAAVAAGRHDIATVSTAMSRSVSAHRPEPQDRRLADARYAQYQRDASAALTGG